MRRILIVGLAAVLAWVAFKNVGYAWYLGTSGSEPQAPDYSFDETWFERPAEPPAGGWVTPWGIDVLLIAPPATEPAAKGMIAADDDRLQQDYDAFVSDLGFEAPSLTVYAPSYRSPSPALSERKWSEGLEISAKDVSAAMSRYLAADNRQRGLIIVAAPDSGPLLGAALAALPDTEAFRQRFGGVILPANLDTSNWEPLAGPCSPAHEACTIATGLESQRPTSRFFSPTLRRPRLHYVSDQSIADLAAERASDLSVWLDENATKPAEPFNTWAADEVVDVSPIRRPNSEADISGERGN